MLICGKPFLLYYFSVKKDTYNLLIRCSGDTDKCGNIKDLSS